MAYGLKACSCHPLINYIYHKLAKFEPTRMIRTTQNLELFFN